MRLDFADQIQVRYHHLNEEEYDTWVSGTEALKRVRSQATEEQLKELSRLNRRDLKLVLDALPELAKGLARESLRDVLADHLQENLGGNILGDSLSDAMRGQNTAAEPIDAERRWRALLRYEPFRQKVLDLAWIQLEGSFPDVEPGADLDDWL
ncbi:MAG: hypothetical protein JSW55_15005 [Chloroflexota bacterium]|nr:MAG: hypothetical protein JSW55_15005 [Chloroflexota bacterium]